MDRRLFHSSLSNGSHGVPIRVTEGRKAMQETRLTRRLVIVLLLFSALTIIPIATSQQFTTTMSPLTTTVAVTNASTQTMTKTLYSFMTSISIGSGTLTGTNNTQRSIQGSVCSFPLFGFFNSTGMTDFQYSVSGPMTLYILSGPLSPTALAGALAGPDCYNPELAYMNWPSYIQQISAGSYPASGSLNLTLPTASNPYTYAMVAPLYEGFSTATLKISPIWGTYTSITTSTIAATSTTSSFTTITYLSTLASVAVLQAPFTQTYELYVGVSIGIVAALVTLYSLHRSKGRRREAKVASDEGTTAEVSEASVDRQFCTQCGLELPIGSRFCTRCGSKQEI